MSKDSGFGQTANEEKAFPIEVRVALPQIAPTAAVASFLSATVEGSRWPSVIAINRFGQERQLLEVQTKKEAFAQTALVRADLESLGLRRWCEKYDVPWSFVTGPPLALSLPPTDRIVKEPGAIRKPSWTVARVRLDQTRKTSNGFSAGPLH